MLCAALVPASSGALAGDGMDPRCAQYGRGFVYSDGTGFCFKLSGSIESGFQFGKTGNPRMSGDHGSNSNGLQSEAEGSLDARKDTELGPLRLYISPKVRTDGAGP